MIPAENRNDVIFSQCSTQTLARKFSAAKTLLLIRVCALDEATLGLHADYSLARLDACVAANKSTTDKNRRFFGNSAVGRGRTLPWPDQRTEPQRALYTAHILDTMPQ